MLCKKLHHAAFRCSNAQATTRFYTGVLGLKFTHAITQDIVPSTGQYCPHIHIFFTMEDGSSIAFFECPTAPGEVKDMASPAWIQHFAFQVGSQDVLHQAKAELEQLGIPVVGPVNHDGFVLSIYFADPSGHRLELTTPLCAPARLKGFEANAPAVLERWVRTREAERREAAVDDHAPCNDAAFAPLCNAERIDKNRDARTTAQVPPFAKLPGAIADAAATELPDVPGH